MDEESGLDAGLGDRVRIIGGRGEHGRAGSPGQERDDIEELPLHGAERRGPGEHGVLHRGEIPGFGRDQLGDHVRHATAQPEHFARVPGRRGCERRHRTRAQRLEPEPAHGSHGRQLAEHRAQRVLSPEIISVRDDEHRARVLHSAPRIDEEVERGRVGPVQILQDDDRRRAVERACADQLDEEPMSIVAVGELRQVATRCAGDVDHGTERSGSVQRVALAPQHPATRAALAQLAHERGLPHPCLTRDHDEASFALIGGRDALVERRELGLSLEELHVRSVGGAGRNQPRLLAAQHGQSAPHATRSSITVATVLTNRVSRISTGDRRHTRCQSRRSASASMPSCCRCS